jgi:ABC-type transporter Mla subunit MlaD
MTIDVRDRLAERVTLERLALELSRSRRALLVVLIGAVGGLLSWGYIFSRIGSNLVASTHTISFAVDDATGVVASRDQVRVKGIPAGTITAVKLVHGTPVLTASIDTKYGAIYNNARAQLRPATALQDMYLDIVDPGTASAGIARAGDPLPASQTDTSVNIADVLEAFNPDVREHMAVVLRDLGGGLADRGARLRIAFSELVPLVRTVGRITDQLSRRSDLTKRLVHNFALLTGELGRRQAQLRTLVIEGAQTLGTLQTSSGSLGATLAQLPPTLSAIDSSLTAVRGVLPDVNGALRALEPVAGRLPSGLTALRNLSSEAKPAVAALQTPIARLVPFAQAVKPLASNLEAAVTALAPQTGAVNHVTDALERCTANQAVQDFFQWTASVFKPADARGVAPRGDLTIGLDSIAGIKDPNEQPTQPTCVTAAPLGGIP